MLQDNTLVFTYLHIIGDGKSGLAFHRALLSALNSQAEPGDSNVQRLVTIPPDITLVAPLEDVIDVSVSFSKLGRVIYDMLVPSSWTKLASAYTGNPVSTDREFDIDVRFLTLAPKDVNHLLQLCRLHGATMTSLLHTVGVVVLAGLIPSLSANTPPIVSTSVPVSLRQYAGTSDLAFCNHISAFSSFIDTSLLPAGDDCTLHPSHFPWDVASQFAATLRQNASATREQVGLLKYLPSPYENFFLSKQGKKREETMELSNLGRFSSPDISKDGSGWSIENMFFFQSNAICGAALKVMVVGSPNDSLGITINWTKGVVDDEFAETFFSSFRDLVQKMAEQGDPASPLGGDTK